MYENVHYHLFFYHSTESYIFKKCENWKVAKCTGSRKGHFGRPGTKTIYIPRERRRRERRKKLCFGDAISQRSSKKYVKIQKSPNTLAHGRIIIGVTWDKKWYKWIASAEGASEEKICALGMRFQKISPKKLEKWKVTKRTGSRNAHFLRALGQKLIQVNRERRRRERRKFLGFEDTILKKFPKFWPKFDFPP